MSQVKARAELIGDLGQFVKIDDMVFPNAHGQRISEVEWSLRHAQEEHITKEDRMLAASIISAYRELVVFKTNGERNYVCSAIKYTGPVTNEKLEATNERG